MPCGCRRTVGEWPSIRNGMAGKLARRSPTCTSSSEPLARKCSSSSRSSEVRTGQNGISAYVLSTLATVTRITEEGIAKLAKMSELPLPMSASMQFTGVSG